VDARSIDSAAKELDKSQKPVLGIQQYEAEIFAVSITERYR
jgi:hypothetical protein